MQIITTTVAAKLNRLLATLAVLLPALSAIAVSSPSAAGAQGAAGGEKIIISGASGQLGGLVVKELLARGVAPENLILVSRTPDNLAEYAGMGASTRYGDFTQPESLPEAYAGGDRMLLISINSGGAQRPDLHKYAIDAARQAGVKHIAYTSFVNMDNNTSPLAADHRRTEQFLKDSGIAWTMLRNHLYMDSLLRQAARMMETGRTVIPLNETPMAYVTREDCAAAAAAVLVTGGHEFQAYDITGPELIGQRELAEAVSEITGKAIAAVNASADDSTGQGGFSLSGDYMRVTSSAVADLTGRPATSVRGFLQANRDKLKP
jgi:NAD(P)H dehydrogenase (quinone)